ncbi:MAG: helix-hairpin-helix domain-containing protein [Sedimentisphaerales bacterium]|nr:helix-hairpin-helix domain-containing protein [Sedimentisphaerales bacterium]
MKHAGQNRIQSFAFVISVCLAVCFAFVFISNIERNLGQCEVELEGRINPNDAPVESLVRLPGLGTERAGAIIIYRQNLDGKNAGKPAFQNFDDLQKVQGIGPKTVQNIRQWLKYE